MLKDLDSMSCELFSKVMMVKYAINQIFSDLIVLMMIKYKLLQLRKFFAETICNVAI